MTDFANDLLWEEETKEPEVAKTPAQEQPVQMTAGNAATAHAMAASKPMMPEPDSPQITATAPAPEIKGIETVNSKPVLGKITKAKHEDIMDWERPLQAVLTIMNGGPLEPTLSAFLKTAAQIPKPQVPMVAAAILSAFLRLPLGSRKAVRDVFIAALSGWSSLPVAQLILIRLGGLAVAAAPVASPTTPADNP